MSVFDEDGLSESNVAVPQQEEIAVYTNERGEVVIRQRNWPDDDVLVFVSPENAARLADAILRSADADDEDGDGDRDSPPARSRPMTPAERKRKQRDKRRDMSRNDITRERDERDMNGGTVILPFSPAIDPESEEEEASAS